MLVGVTVWLGFYVAHAVEKRSEMLECCIRLIRTFDMKIGYSGEPVNEIIKKSVEDEELKALTFLKNIANSEQSDFYQAWKENIEEFSTFSYLNKGDIALLLSFGEKLGTTDISYQTQLCNEYLTLFEDRYQTAKQKKAERLKICRLSGAICGLIEIILML